ncbi:class I SAM-dependent methyltransferase [Gordonia sinesedis]
MSAPPGSGTTTGVEVFSPVQEAALTTCQSIDSVDPAEPVRVSAQADATLVYAPQEDSQLLVDVCESTGRCADADVADLCTGTGVVAIACGRLGARSVTAIDSCTAAARAATTAARSAGVRISVRHGDFGELAGRETFDLVTCNPPYVPSPAPDSAEFVECPGPRHAWAAGVDGRAVLDRLCSTAAALLRPGGTLLVVQSEFADVPATVRALRATGLAADVVAERSIPFGPVMNARAEWLERTGRLERGRRVEQIAVVRADKAPADTMEVR